MDRVLRRIAIGFGLLLAILLVLVPAWIAAHRTDLPTPNDGDLAVRLTELAEGDNGFDDLADAAELLYWPEDRSSDERLHSMWTGESWEPAWLEEMLTRNARALAALQRALEAPAMQFPPYQDAALEQVDVLIATQRLAKLAGAGARLQLEQGDRERAIERALVGMRLGKRLSGGEGIGLFQMMTATALQTRSLTYLEGVVRRISLDAAAARELVAQLDSACWTADAWGRMWAGEYQQFKTIVLEVPPSHDGLLSDVQDGTPPAWPWRLIPETYLWQPNRTLSSLADQFRTRQHRSALACREARARPLRGGDRNHRLARAIVSQNPLGNILVEIATPNLDSFDLKRCHLETNIALLRTLIASKAYWDTHGRLPSSLDDLVPRYLPDIPQDRFSGKRLAYSEARRLVYSVGEDYLDAGGGETPSRWDRNEPAISLAF